MILTKKVKYSSNQNQYIIVVRNSDYVLCQVNFYAEFKQMSTLKELKCFRYDSNRIKSEILVHNSDRCGYGTHSEAYKVNLIKPSSTG